MLSTGCQTRSRLTFQTFPGKNERQEAPWKGTDNDMLYIYLRHFATWMWFCYDSAVTDVCASNLACVLPERAPVIIYFTLMEYDCTLCF